MAQESARRHTLQARSWRCRQHQRLPSKRDQISKLFAITSTASSRTALYWLPLLIGNRISPSVAVAIQLLRIREKFYLLLFGKLLDLIWVSYLKENRILGQELSSAWLHISGLQVT